MKIFPTTIFLVALASRQVFATNSSETITEKFRNEKRFTLYNSRKLEGKCLTVCEPEETEAPTAATSTVSSMASSSASSTIHPTDSPTIKPRNEVPTTNRPSIKPTNEPTNEPTSEPTNKPTNEPTNEPTNKPTNAPTSDPTNKPTNEPTNEPTNKPTNAPTSDPTNKPTNEPTNEPTKFPTSAPSDVCKCAAGDETAMSWKCGLHVYVCPGVDEICSKQGGNNGIYMRIDQEQCDAMKNIELGQKCVALPQYNINTNKERKSLSNRVCYGEGHHGYKTDSGGCDECKKPKVPPFVTDAPTGRPTIELTNRPTGEPTKTPTNEPTDGSSYECVWPQAQYSAITKGDMINGAKNVYKKLAVGGSFINPSNSHVTVNGRVYYGNRVQGRVNYNGGKQKINDLADIPVDYEQYEWLARNLKNSNIQGKRVIVKTTGNDAKRNGCYSTYDFTPGGQGEDNGNTLVVFNTTDDICLTKTHDGRQFGPTVLAPFSKVTLTNSGFLDGTVIAKEFTTVVGYNKGTEQQLHGDNYKGQVQCV